MGVILIISSLTLYFVDPSLFLSMRSWILLTIIIVLMIKTGLDERRIGEGFIDFGDAFRSMFIASAIGILFCTMFEYIMFNIIDPGLIETQREIALEAIEKMSGFLGEDGYEMAVERIQDQEFNTPAQTLISYLVRQLVPNALFSAIIALIIKRKQQGV